MPSAEAWQEHKKRRNRSADRVVEEARGGEVRGEEDFALGCQSRMAEGGLVPPPSVLAPGSALRSVPTVALPSAQVRGMVGAPEGAVEPDKTERSREEVSFGRLFDRSCRAAT